MINKRILMILTFSLLELNLAISKDLQTLETDRMASSILLQDEQLAPYEVLECNSIFNDLFELDQSNSLNKCNEKRAFLDKKYFNEKDFESF